MATSGFNPASEQDVFSIEEPHQSISRLASTLTGQEARQFYKDLAKHEKEESGKMDKESKRKDRCKTRESKRRERHRAVAVQVNPSRTTESGGTSSAGRSGELQGLRLLRCAHQGDTSALKDLLSKGADVNFQDSFFWTALMCASWSGHRAAVRLLLERGAAWVGVVDLQGRDAGDLALEAGHKGVLEELQNYGRSQKKNSQASTSAPCGQWCDVCGSMFSGSRSSHFSSTLHQFSLRRPPPTPHYCLPPSSTSYKMMLRCGWTPGTGLGPEGSGPHQPVPTVLKQDQQGLGYGQSKRAKVTHFQARDTGAIKAPSKRKEERVGRGLRREESRRKEERDKNWERDFRASFYL